MNLINPTTEEPIQSFPDHSPAEVDRLLDASAAGFKTWRATSFEERAERFQKIARLLRERKPDLAVLMTHEMGKPINGGEAEIEKCASACEVFAENAEGWLAPQPIETDAVDSYVRFDPIGPILAIMPWNFPFWQFFRAAVPAMMAGNTAVLKHAPNVPGCGEAIEELFRDAEFPEGAFINLRVPNDRAELLIQHSAIAAVTLTGSERAGKAVAAAAAMVLKRSVLELGGSDPFIVLPDAKLDAVAQAAVDARCINTGQSCIAAKRFIVIGDAEQFAQKMADIMRRLVIGNPLERKTQLGPLARLDLLENLDSQVQRSIAAGATLLTGGKRLPRKGWFYEPSVLLNVQPGMAAFDEETFGPVAAVIAAKDTEDAVRLANLSHYGLGASVWTEDPFGAESLAARLEAGNVFINGAVKSDPRLPFGGVKNSGWGRELSAIGLREFTNVKTVWIK
jgi:succinate-semialdehyde dehydrogenase/glutarate-semialdehyde dehydrogenase